MSEITHFVEINAIKGFMSSSLSSLWALISTQTLWWQYDQKYRMGGWTANEDFQFICFVMDCQKVRAN